MLYYYSFELLERHFTLSYYNVCKAGTITGVGVIMPRPLCSIDFTGAKVVKELQMGKC